MSLQEDFAKDVTASRPDAEVLWVASNDIASAFRMNPEMVWEAANENAAPNVLEPALKRTLDLAIAIPALILLAPLLAIISLIVYIDTGAPVLFRQTRLGRGGKPFDIFKFRTMTVMENGDTIVQAKANDLRVTRSGKWLRKSSIDELPQLLNVIAGDMSIVGPRPHARAHDVEYGKLIAGYNLRQTVKPGMTGWAQVNGHRGETPTTASMKARVDFDIWYARHMSILLDLKIIVRTPMAVLGARNAH